MYNVLNIGIGLAVLAGLLVIFCRACGVGIGIPRGALVFLPVWLIGVGNELRGAMHQSGFSIKEDGLGDIIQFGVPACVALIVWWTFRSQTSRP